MNNSLRTLSENVQNDRLFTLDFVGIGPQKTASTWLHEMLGKHPSICLPTATKELQFFDRLYHQSINDYVSYFKHCKPNQLCGEITPGYFDTPEAPIRISKHFPKSKIIVSLRHPVKRTESLYLHHLRKGRVSKDFTEAVAQLPRIKESGKYRKHLQTWFNHFQPEKIKIVITEDIATRPEKILDELYQFLSLEHHIPTENLHNKVNKAGLPKYPWLAKYAAQIVEKLKDYQMHKIVEIGKAFGLKKVYSGGSTVPTLSFEEKMSLYSYFKEDIQFVENLLNRKLNTWHQIE